MANITKPLLTLHSDNTKLGSLPIGIGGGDVATNVAIGSSALCSNTTGASNTAIGNIELGWLYLKEGRIDSAKIKLTEAKSLLPHVETLKEWRYPE